MMRDSGFLAQFINKTVNFRFQRQDLRFHLSQSLFSSFDVDDGTKHLLKTVAQRLDVERARSVLDVGCGVGVLGICLKKRYPDIEVTFQDRDALALAFTDLNCRLNQLGSVIIQGSLALQNVAGKQFDLIVSNLPGKAGAPVLRDILARIPDHLSDRGVAAVVVVRPLVELVKQTLTENECEILFQENRAENAVFHYKGTRPQIATGDPQAPYLRGSFLFKAAEYSFEQTTAHNIPEFDTLSYQTRLVIAGVKGEEVAGKVLFWNPGQGHLATFLALKCKDHISRFVIASRDLLSLQISKLNLIAHGVAANSIMPVHVPHLLRIEDRYDYAIIIPDIDPGVPWHQALMQQCHNILVPGARAIVVARSSFMHRTLTANPGLDLDIKVKASKKRWGFRCIVVQKSEASSIGLNRAQ